MTNIFAHKIKGSSNNWVIFRIDKDGDKEFLDMAINVRSEDEAIEMYEKGNK